MRALFNVNTHWQLPSDRLGGGSAQTNTGSPTNESGLSTPIYKHIGADGGGVSGAIIASVLSRIRLASSRVTRVVGLSSSIEAEKMGEEEEGAEAAGCCLVTASSKQLFGCSYEANFPARML